VPQAGVPRPAPQFFRPSVPLAVALLVTLRRRSDGRLWPQVAAGSAVDDLDTWNLADRVACLLAGDSDPAKRDELEYEREALKRLTAAVDAAVAIR
jgi:hypothetical protein